MSDSVQLKEKYLDNLRQALPPVFNRHTAEEVLGRAIKARTLANLDCLKQGPPKLRLGKIVTYERDSFLAWVAERLTADD